MASHVKVLGILHLVFGILGVLVALFLLALFGGIAGVVSVVNNPDSQVAIPILGGLGIFLFTLVTVLSLPGIIAGIGLLLRKRWGRILTIVLSALELLNFPFGTALGAYGLWVLLSNQSQAVFEAPHLRQRPV